MTKQQIVNEIINRANIKRETTMTKVNNRLMECNKEWLVKAYYFMLAGAVDPKMVVAIGAHIYLSSK